MIRLDVSQSSISEQDRTMLRYVEKLTLRPGTVEREDVEALRAAGFSDPGIVDIAAHVALFSFMNRIVDGLGGKLSDDMPERARRFGLPLHAGTYE
ncbi:MAG TPA: peroxidase [Candidatus Limnocylindria bacterium]|nr:peroxidase [Candidatus Limnocylindria bacterium]